MGNVTFGFTSFGGSSSSNGGSSSGVSAVGTFFDTTTQFASIENNPYEIQFNNTDISEFVQIANLSEIRPMVSGNYSVVFSAQLENFDSVNSGIVSMWLRKNGSDIPNSTNNVVLESRKTLLASWNYLVNIPANNNIEIVWCTSNINIKLVSVDKIPNTPYPASPSVFLNINKI
jgi:hypothetical protein